MQLLKNYQFRQKYIFIILIIFIVQTIIPSSFVFALDESFPFDVNTGAFNVTFVNTTIIDDSGSTNEIGDDPSNPLNGKIDYKILYNLEIDNYVNPALTTTSASIKLKIPNDFVIQKTIIPINVTGIDPNSPVKIADVFIEEDGNAEIKFINIDPSYNDVYSLSNVYFSIGMHLDETKLVSEGEKIIKFEVSDKSINKSFYVKPYVPPTPSPINAKIVKNGNFNSSNNIVDWTITINDLGNQIEPGAVIYDKLDTKKLTFIKIKDSLGNTVNSNFDINTGVLTHTLPNTLTVPYSIIIETKLNENEFQSTGITSLINKSVIKNSDGKIVSNEARAQKNIIGVGENTLLKEGKYNPQNHRITWKITAFTKLAGLDGSIIKDTIDSKENLVVSSIKLNGSPINPTLVSYDTISKNLEIGPIDVTNAMTEITFETEVLNQEHYASNYTPSQYWNYINKVSMQHKKGPDLLSPIYATGYAHVESKVIDKKGISYDYSNKEITWEVTINHNNMPIPNAIITDVLPEGQSYVDNSYVLFDQNKHKLDPSSEMSFSVLENNGIQTLEFKFLNTINHKYTLTFKTKLSDNYAATLFDEAGIKEVLNTASLSGDSIYSGKITVTAKKQIENFLISKFGEQKGDSSGIKVNQPVTWEIVVNPNMINIEYGIITDKLSPELSLNSTSIKLFEMNIASNGTKTLGNQIFFDSSSIEFDYAQNEIKFRLPSPSNKCYKLIFETTLDDPNITKVSNEAYFSGTGMKKVESTKYENVYVQITSSGGNASKKLGSIKINKLDSTDPNNKLPLSGATFELIDSLGLIVSSKTSDNNGIVEFSKLRLNESYTIRESSAPSGYDKSLISETVKLTPLASEKTLTIYNERSRGSVIIKKIDDSKKPLKGATFEIYNYPFNKNDTPLSSSISEENGIAKFENLLYGKYFILEKSAPSGYIIKNQGENLEILSNLPVELTIVNYKKPSSGGGGTTPNEPEEPNKPTEPDKPTEPANSNSDKNTDSDETIINPDIDNILKKPDDIYSVDPDNENFKKIDTPIDPNSNPKTGDFNTSSILFSIIILYAIFIYKVKFRNEKE